MLFFLEKLTFFIIISLQFSTSLGSQLSADCGKRFLIEFLPQHYYFLIPCTLTLIFCGKLPVSLRDWSSVILAPLSEEIVFRGYLCNLLLYRLKVGSAILVSSLCFACLHVLSLYSIPSVLFLIRQVVARESITCRYVPVW